MKKLTILIIFCTATLAAAAQKNNTNQFYINIGGDAHFNKGDATNETNGAAPLSASNKIGTRLGFEYCHKTTSGLFFATGLDYRYIPQKVVLNYNSGQMGFANTNTSYNYEFVYNNHNIAPYFRLGYAMPLKDSGRCIDYSFGAAASIPVTGKYGGDETVALNINDAEYTDAVLFYHSQWGNITDVTVPVNLLLVLQFSYKTTFSGRNLQAGINLTGGTGRAINKTTINYFDAERKSAGTSIFADKYHSIGLFIGVGI